MDLISRAEAKAQGLKRYFTGKPCKHGHVAERYVSTFYCIVCQRDIHKKRYRDVSRIEIVERQRQHRIKYREILNEKTREWQRRYPEKAAKSRERYCHEGPQNPRSELQWLRKAQAMNRSLKRFLKSSNPEHFPWL